MVNDTNINTLFYVGVCYSIIIIIRLWCIIKQSTLSNDRGPTKPFTMKTSSGSSDKNMHKMSNHCAVQTLPSIWISAQLKTKGPVYVFKPFLPSVIVWAYFLHACVVCRMDVCCYKLTMAPCSRVNQNHIELGKCSVLEFWRETMSDLLVTLRLQRIHMVNDTSVLQENTFIRCDYQELNANDVFRWPGD